MGVSDLGGHAAEIWSMADSEENARPHSTVEESFEALEGQDEVS